MNEEEIREKFKESKKTIIDADNFYDLTEDHTIEEINKADYLLIDGELLEKR